MILGLHHAQITVPPTAVAAARAFYCDLLGLSEIPKPDALRANGGFWLLVGDQEIHVGVEESAARRETKAHLAYEVDDLAQWRARLTTAGMTLQTSTPIPGYDRFEFRDPFGNRIEMIQRLPLSGSQAPTRRFSSRVDDYVKYRPSYPASLLDLLAREFDFTPTAVVADIGSGTGILTRLFLDHGNPVYAVEPNPEMRAAAEAALSGYTNFTSIAATAEATTLPDQSVDWITAAQAFHWFDARATAVEWNRVLRANGLALLVWNAWRSADGPFLQGYSDLLGRYSLDYGRTSRTRSEQTIPSFFGGRFDKFVLSNPRAYSWEQLAGRVRSSSYAPLPDHPNFAPLMDGLRALFDEQAVDGAVTVTYDTRLYVGRPAVN